MATSGEPAKTDGIFRVRGGEPTRVDAFVDAAFAFAVTLLVIAIGRVPESVPDLVRAMRGVPAFAASFFIIARLWQVHRLWSRHYGIEDAFSTRASLVLVFLMLVYVYPLRMISTMVFAAWSGGILAEAPLTLDSVDELRMLYAIFALGYLAVAIVFVLMHRHALALADSIALSPAERLATRTRIGRWIAIGAIALVSLALAGVLPMGNERPWLYSVPGLVYALILVVGVVQRRRERDLLAGLAERAP